MNVILFLLVQSCFFNPSLVFMPPVDQTTSFQLVFFVSLVRSHVLLLFYFIRQFWMKIDVAVDTYKLIIRDSI